MSILSSFLRSVGGFLRDEYIMPIIDLIYPPTCPVCGELLISNDQYICTKCRLDAPLTYFWQMTYNPMAERVQNIRPEIRHASALIYYVHKSRWRDLIHRFKYKNEYRHGLRMGRWLGSMLRESEGYKEVDCVVAVPLHPLRQLRRGYNQSDALAQGIAEAMGCELLRRKVRRIRHNASQASTEKSRRWDNVEGLFAVNNPRDFADRRVLLVDDVFTTGATVLSCAETILNAAPSCELWIATLAVSNSEFGFSKR